MIHDSQPALEQVDPPRKAFAENNQHQHQHQREQKLDKLTSLRHGSCVQNLR